MEYDESDTLNNCSNVDQNRAVRRVFDEKVIENVTESVMRMALRMSLRMSIDQVIRGGFFRLVQSLKMQSCEDYLLHFYPSIAKTP